jgi:hypothetical protein
MTSFGFMLLIVLNLGLLAQAHGDSPAESIQQSAGSNLPQNSFCPGETVSLKGQSHEIFDFWFFSWISFPQAPEYTITAISRRYSRLKVHHRCQRHRWQMEKIFNEKNFNYLVWTPLSSRVNIFIIFCLQVHFKESAAWYCFHISLVLLTPVANFPTVALIPVAICHQYQQH